MTERLVIFAISLAITLPATAASAQEFSIRTDDVAYSDAADEPAVGFFARPDIDGKRPAIILIHEWWGLNDDIKAKARKFAELGYVALAVDLYNGESTAEASRARALAGEVRGNMDVAQQNLKDAIALLKESPHVDPDRIASIGWCFGGGWSYEIAKNDLGVKASVIYYGRFNPDDDLSKMRAKIIGHFAENDRGIRVDNVREFQANLRTLNGEHEIYIYPNTTHGFASREGSNPNFDEDAARQAWERTLEFLKARL